MSFDTRKKEDKIADEIQIRIDRDLVVLMGSYIPVEHYDTILKDETHEHWPTMDDYWFAEPGLGIIHCYSHDDKGVKIRRWIQNVRYVNKVYFKIGE